MACTDCVGKTVHELCIFLESRFKKSNKQAIQKVLCQLHCLVYVEGTDRDEHLNKFGALIAQLTM